VDPDEVLRFQGYKRGGSIPGTEVIALFEEASALGRALIIPRAVVAWSDVRRQAGDTLELAEVALSIPDITRHWGQVEQVGAAVVTIGAALEQRVAELWEQRELPLAVMLDSFGSGAVESLAEHVNDLLCQQAIPRGLRVTNRISPGYGAWDVADQRVLFRLCPGQAIDVTLNDACFMTPTKSITLLVGAGVSAHVDHYFSQCARCWMADCAFRRMPARRSVHR
jgi:cobalamin-dependent methionine synthase I